MKSGVSWFARSPVAANVLMILIITIGGLSLVDMQRETFPAATLDAVSVTVPYPGAAPSEVEASIVRVVEEQIVGLDGLRDLTSTAREGLGTVVATFEPGTTIATSLDDIRNRISAVSTFPQDAEEPLISENQNLDLVAFCVLTGDLPEAALREWAFDLKDRLIDQGIASQVQIDGIRDREFHIEINRSALENLQLSVSQIANAVQRASVDIPGGSVTTYSRDYLLRVAAKRYDAQAFENIVVRGQANGNTVKLGDIATITNTFEDVPLTTTYNGQTAVQITVVKSDDDDVLTINDALTAFIDEANGWEDDNGQHAGFLPPELQLVRTFAWADLVQGRLDLLTNNGLIGLVLVFFVLWFFTTWRVALWVGAGLPVALLGTLWFLDLQGASINMISMFAMIMALGILVDDAIIVAENIFARLELGDKPQDAVVNGTNQVLTPIIGATATSMAAFLPLAMVPGVIGQFMIVMPITIAAGLLFSLIESFLILPRHLYHSMRVKHALERRGNYKPNRIRARIDSIINWCIEHFVLPMARLTVRFRYIVLTTTFSVLLICAGLIASGIVGFKFFPNPEGDALVATVRFPVGTPEHVTRQQVVRLEAALQRSIASFGDKGKFDVSGKPADLIQHVTTIVGGIPSPTGGNTVDGGHVGGFIVTALGNEYRQVSLFDVQDAWIAAAESELLPGIDSFQVEEARGGPGGDDIDIRFSANDWESLAGITETVRTALGQQEGVYNIDDDYVLGKPELQFFPNEVAANLGIDETSIGLAVRNRFQGGEAIRFQDGREEVTVRLIAPEAQRNTIETVMSTLVPTAMGNLVPLRNVATYREERNIATINRFNRKRVVKVTAALQPTSNTADILAALGKKGNEIEPGSVFDRLQTTYGAQFNFEGVAATQAETMKGLGQGLIVALFAIFAILVLSFRNWLQPIVIITLIPVGFVGAVLGHLVLNIPMTIISMFGIVGLAGIVVNDAITLVHFINENRNNGHSVPQAVVQAIRARFRPIIMTSATTVAGLLPLLLERSLQAQFLIPMAASISFGLIVSTIGTLVVIPAFYVVIQDLVGVWRSVRDGIDPLHHLKQDGDEQV